jgi:hypothetical protein
MPKWAGVRYPDLKPRGYLAAALIALATLVAALATPAAAGARPVRLTVDLRHPGRAIPASFLGLGIEYQTLPLYTGTDPNAVDPVLEQLIRNLTPGQTPVLRIGGDTTDWSWWPVPGRSKPPPGVSYSLTPQWAAVTRSLDQALHARLIMGINFEADDRQIVQTEARELVDRLGASSIYALELGNEPELYHSFGWYNDANGNPVPGRPASWGFPMFQKEFSSLTQLLPALPVAGPTTGNLSWDPDFATFLAQDKQVRVATVHRYPLWVCNRGKSNPLYPTIGHLLTRHATVGLAQSVAHLVRIAHARRLPLRVDEMNMTPCPAQAAWIQPSVGTALWSADILFEMLGVGVDGVNVQSSTAGTQDIFHFTQTSAGWRGMVAPEYYGLLMFARAAPAGSRLAHISEAPLPLRAWATRARDGSLRVLVINNGRATRSIAVGGTSGKRPATLERLQGGREITLGGQTFGSATTTGQFPGPERLATVTPNGQRYSFSVPGRSAALLTVP